MSESYEIAVWYSLLEIEAALSGAALTRRLFRSIVGLAKTAWECLYPRGRYGERACNGISNCSELRA